MEEGGGRKEGCGGRRGWEEGKEGVGRKEGEVQEYVWRGTERRREGGGGGTRVEGAGQHATLRAQHTRAHISVTGQVAHGLLEHHVEEQSLLALHVIWSHPLPQHLEQVQPLGDIHVGTVLCAATGSGDGGR